MKAGHYVLRNPSASRIRHRSHSRPMDGRERHPRRASHCNRGRGERSSEEFRHRGRNRSLDEPMRNRQIIPRGGIRDSSLRKRLNTKSTCTPFFPQGPDEACRMENVRQVSPNLSVPRSRRRRVVGLSPDSPIRDIPHTSFPSPRPRTAIGRMHPGPGVCIREVGSGRNPQQCLLPQGW